MHSALKLLTPQSIVILGGAAEASCSPPRILFSHTVTPLKRPTAAPYLLPPPSSPGPSNGSLRMAPDALPPFQQGQTAKSKPFSCSSGSLQPKALPTLIWLRPPSGTDVLKLHEGLRAESSLAIQLRTGTNGLDVFPFQARVPSVPSPLCSSGRERQMAKHVLIFCLRHAGARHELRDEQ